MPQAHFLLPMQLASPVGDSEKFMSMGRVHVPGAVELSEAYSRYMSPAPRSQSYIPPSPIEEVEETEKGVNWSDPRIQAWNGPERNENGVYNEAMFNYRLSRSTQLVNPNHLTSVTSNADEQSLQQRTKGSEEAKIMVFGPPSKNDGKMFRMISPDEMLEQVSSTIAEKKKMVTDTKPHWLTEWDTAKATVQEGLSRDKSTPQSNPGRRRKNNP